MKKTKQDYLSFINGWRRFSSFMDILLYGQIIIMVISFVSGYSDISSRALVSFILTVIFGAYATSGKNKWIEDYDNQHSDRP